MPHHKAKRRRMVKAERERRIEKSGKILPTREERKDIRKTRSKKEMGQIFAMTAALAVEGDKIIQGRDI